MIVIPPGVVDDDNEDMPLIGLWHSKGGASYKFSRHNIIQLSKSKIKQLVLLVVPCVPLTIDGFVTSAVVGAACCHRFFVEKEEAISSIRLLVLVVLIVDNAKGTIKYNLAYKIILLVYFFPSFFVLLFCFFTVLNL